MSEDATLTPRQAKFVAEFLVTGNGTQAAVAAGYSLVSARVGAHRLLTKAAVRAAIEDQQGVDARRLQIDRQDVIQGLLEAVQMAREQQEPAAMVSAWRELGRLMGFYAPERRLVEVSAAAGAEGGRYERMSDAELQRLVAAAG